MKYYMMMDWTANKRNPGFGFANTKIAKVFATKKERDEVVNDRKFWDLSCKATTRNQATKLREALPDNSKGVFFFDSDKFLMLGSQTLEFKN